MRLLLLLAAILSPKVIFVGACALGAGVCAVYYLQLLLIYPSSINDGRGHCATPAEYDMNYEEVRLPTKDGESLHCYALKHDGVRTARKTVVILSPNAGNIGHAMPIVSVFYRTFGYNVFIYSYRGYGKLTGVASEKGLKIDARTVLDYLTTNDFFRDTHLVLYGRSLGGAVAIYMCLIMPDAVLGLILENTFLSIPKTVPHIFPVLKSLTRLVHQVWDSERLMPLIPSRIPVLFFSARRDEVVPPSHMDRLHQLSQAEHKVMYKYELSFHNDTVAQPEYWERVREFLKSRVAPVE